MRTVHVVSWVYWGGDEQVSGGFDWYDHLSDATSAFYQDRDACVSEGTTARIRLVTVPDVPLVLTHSGITEYLDSDIESLESVKGFPARKVALVNVLGPAPKTLEELFASDDTGLLDDDEDDDDDEPREQDYEVTMSVTVNVMVNAYSDDPRKAREMAEKWAREAFDSADYAMRDVSVNMLDVNTPEVNTVLDEEGNDVTDNSY